MIRAHLTAVAAGVVMLAFVAVDASHAACTRLAYSVNDYGKEGPTRDAKNLLETYIAKWTSERGITGYRIGPKTVTCKLFLDFILFDEYTCKASASVCWQGRLPQGHSAQVEPDPEHMQAARAGGRGAPAASDIATGSLAASAAKKNSD